MEFWYYVDKFAKGDKVKVRESIKVDNAAFRAKNRVVITISPDEILTVTSLPQDNIAFEDKNQYDVTRENGDKISDIPEYLLVKVS